MRSAILRLLALLFAVQVFACSAPPEPPAAIPGPARRIVSLAPNLTEILFALDLGDRVVGVTDYCNWPPEAAAKAHIGGYVNPNLEAILELRPDLAVATPNIGNRDAVLKLQSLGVDFLVVDTPDFAGLFDAVRAIGDRAGVPERGEALAARIASEIDAVRADVAGRPTPRALLVFAHDPLVVAGGKTFFHEMLVAAGGENVAAGAQERFPHYSLEQIVAERPDVLIETVMSPDGTPDVGFWERYEVIPAVRDGRICTPAPDLILRPGPRTPIGVRLLADCLHGRGDG